MKYVIKEICALLGLFGVVFGILAVAIGLLFSMHRPWWVYVPFCGVASILLGCGLLFVAHRIGRRLDPQSEGEQREAMVRKDMTF